MVLKILVDTCVWLDMAKDYRHQPTLEALERLMEAGEVELILPSQVIDEFQRNRDRIIRDSGKSLSSTFKRAKEAVRQFGIDAAKDLTLSTLDDVDHRITILGEAVNESIARVEKIFSSAKVVETSSDVKLRAAQRAIDKVAPFHRDKNSIGDAILVEVYRDLLTNAGDEVALAFVTHNKHDFSNPSGDECTPHPDLAELFAGESSTYGLALGEVLHVVCAP